MKASELENFKSKLLSLKNEVENDLLDPSAADESITPDNAIGRLTRMEAIQAQSIANAGKVRQKKRLDLIDRALASIEDGTYGSCVVCGADIQVGRLEIRPESRACIRCARR